VKGKQNSARGAEKDEREIHKEAEKIRLRSRKPGQKTEIHEQCGKNSAAHVVLNLSVAYPRQPK
jgi:hypothetical protein